MKQRGFSLFGFLVVTAVTGVLTALLLSRLDYYQGVAEQARIALTLRALNGALKVQMGQMMIAGQAHRWSELRDANPFEWLDRGQTTGHYCGPADDGTAIRPGCWAYVAKQHEVVYRLQDLEPATLASEDGLLRFRLDSRNRTSSPASDLRLRLQAVRPYTGLEAFW